jgi:hypothetical protein
MVLRGGGGREGQNRVDSQARRSFRGLIGNNHAVSGLGKSCSFMPIGKPWLVGLVGLVMTKSSCLVRASHAVSSLTKSWSFIFGKSCSFMSGYVNAS